MGVVYTQGQILGRGDLDIFLTNVNGNATNAASLAFAIYWVDPNTGTEILIGDAARTAVNPSVGEYYAAIMIPASAAPGNYRIRWTFREMSNYPDQQVVQEFGVVAEGTTTVITGGVDGSLTHAISECESDLIRKLRFLLRDNDPSRNYHFRPPTGEGEINCYNQVFGYIWQDEELYEYLEMALWKWNMHPPETEELRTVNALCQSKPSWKAALLWGSLVTAAQALAYNWIADEFSIVTTTLLRIKLPTGEWVALPIGELYDIVEGTDE